MPSSHPTPAPCHWFSALAAALDVRSAPRLVTLFLGALLARGRRTVTQWLRAAGQTADYRAAYTALAATGRNADAIAARLLDRVRPLVAAAPRVVLALDDTPTPRYGPHVRGAGVHHNPTPDPAGSPFVYGHVWVVLALLAPHPAWGTLALPLLARLYVRRTDTAAAAFRTKLQFAVDLVRWATTWVAAAGQAVWVVVDGAYAQGPFLKPVRGLGVTVVSRLRQDARLQTLPGPRRPGQRGRPRVYGEHRIDLRRRAGQRRGWSRGTFRLYGKPTPKRYQTFLATWRPAGGVIRVVLVDEPTGWRAYFCTDATATVADVLERVAERFSLETAFRECKQVVGAGQQQVRKRSANVGAFHVCLWTVTLTAVWAWDQPAGELTGHRGSSPWDDPLRRPSHADQRRAWQRAVLGAEIQAACRPGASAAEIHALAERLMDLAA